MLRERSTTRPSVSDWPLVPVPPPRGASLSALEARLGSDRRDADEILGTGRKRDRLGEELVDRVVGREHRAIGMAEAELPLEAAGPQLGQELDMQRGRRGNPG